MSIFIAKSAGFCPGVRNAVKVAEKTAADCKNQNTGRVPYTIGELIHNAREAARLAELGIRAAENIVGLPRNAFAIIRSHGVSDRIYAELDARGIPYADATCPKVSRIHAVVREITADGGAVVVVGTPRHPEVAGILGCADERGRAVAADDTEDLRTVLKEIHRRRITRVALAAQTTFDSGKWEVFKAVFREYFPAENTKAGSGASYAAEIYDTICAATRIRQREAAEMCGYCDLMVVAGDKHSSNTAKLYDICKKKRPSILVDGGGELRNYIAEIRKVQNIRAANNSEDITVGIIAGASAPAYIIEEVHAGMSEILQTDKGRSCLQSEMTAGDLEFLEMVDKTVKKIFTGKRVRATVDEVRETEVIVNIGTKHSGYIPADELSENKNLKPSDLVNVGDEFECVVTSINDNDGVVMLSKRKVDSAVGFEKCLKAYDTNGILEGTVSGVVNGGVIIVYEGARVFIPASQSGVSRTGKLEELKGLKYPFKVIEINEQRSRVVGSIRQAKNESNSAIREKFWNEVEIGQKFEGEVKSMESYGVFVDLGGVDGMVHLSELSWNRIRHPRDVVSVGDKLSVYVKGFDKEKRRVSLGAKDPAGNPWEKFLNDFRIGDIVKVQIVNIATFGAFAQIIPGIDGLIHISQITQKRVTDVGTVLRIGQIVDAKITDIEQDKNRVSLSMKATIEDGYADILDEQTEVEPAAYVADDTAVAADTATDNADDVGTAETAPETE